MAFFLSDAAVSALVNVCDAAVRTSVDVCDAAVSTSVNVCDGAVGSMEMFVTLCLCRNKCF